MTIPYRSRPHTTNTSPSRRRSPATEGRSRRRRTLELVSEAVVAGYIHEISARGIHGIEPSGGSRAGRSASAEALAA